MDYKKELEQMRKEIEELEETIELLYPGLPLQIINKEETIYAGELREISHS